MTGSSADVQADTPWLDMTQGQRPPGSGLHGLEGACLSPLLHGFHSGIAVFLIKSRTVE